MPTAALGEATTKIQHTGSGVNPARQAGPHAHFILPSPDNRFTLNCDLGLDKIFNLSSGRGRGQTNAK